MYTVAKKIEKVEEIAYIRANVTLKVDNAVLKAKNIIVLGGDITVITYEYEKLHKRCFSCFRLTHEKSRCPYSKKK